MHLQYFESEWKERPESIVLARERAKALWKEDYSLARGEVAEEIERNQNDIRVISSQAE